MNSLNAFKFVTGHLCQQKGWDRANIYHVWLLFTEEVGELASAIRQGQRLYKKTLKKDRGVDLMSEMGDVFSYLFQIAFMLDIDLDEMWALHYQKAQHKIYKTTTEHVDWMPNREGSGKCPLFLQDKRMHAKKSTHSS